MTATRSSRPRPHAGARRPRVAVLVFPGSNDDRDAAEALASVGAEPMLVWHAEPDLSNAAAAVLPGGFSYGDYLRCGAIARFAPATRAVTTLAARGGTVLGICNGFQILCEAGLLPGTLRPNASLSFVCRDVVVTVENDETRFTHRCQRGQRLTIPIKHGEGCWYADASTRAALDARKQIVLRYAPGENPNGSVDDVAGVVNEARNVMGLMPHPEHAVDPVLGSADGALILESFVESARGAARAAA